MPPAGGSRPDHPHANVTCHIAVTAAHRARVVAAAHTKHPRWLTTCEGTQVTEGHP